MESINIFDMALRAAKTNEEKRDIILKYLERKCNPEERKIVQDFPEGRPSRGWPLHQFRENCVTENIYLIFELFKQLYEKTSSTNFHY